MKCRVTTIPVLIAVLMFAAGGVWAGTFGPFSVTDQTSTAPLPNPTPASYQPRYVSGFGIDDVFKVFFEDRDAANQISYNMTTTGPTGFAAANTATNISDTHFCIKDWPITIGMTSYAYRAWGSVGNNLDHHFYVSNDLTTWTLVSTFQIPNHGDFAGARGWVYYGFHDVIELNGTYYAFAESNQGQTMLVRSDEGDDVWEAFASVGGTQAGDGPLQMPESPTPRGSFVVLGYDRGYGKIHVRGNDSGYYLAINTAAKPSLGAAGIEAAFINPANWTWDDGSTGLPTVSATPVLVSTPERDIRECWVVPNSDPDDDWVIMYDGDFGVDGGKALGYATLTPPPPPPVRNVTKGTYYGTIQAGVGDADPGNTLECAAGLYEEHVEITLALTLSGAGAATTIVDGTNTGNAVTITSSDVTVTGFKVTGGYSNGGTVFDPYGGIVINGNDGVSALTGITIEDNVIEGNYGLGVFISAAGDGGAPGNVLVKHCTILNNAGGAGISLTYEDQYPSYSGPWGTWDEWRRPKNVLIEANFVGGNTDYGIYVNSGNNNVVKSDTLSGNSKYGIQLVASMPYTEIPCEYTAVEDNEIFDNGRNGVKLTSFNHHNTFTGNNIYDNGFSGTSDRYKYGFLFQDGNNNTLDGNTITGNALGGLYLWGQGDPSYTWYSTTDNVIIQNTIADHTGAGGNGIYIPARAGYPNSGFLNSSINSNSITNNLACGLENADATQIVDATQNWWGDASGPEHATTNTSATGDEVSDDADYSPWWGADYVGDAHASPWTWYVNTSNGSTIQEGVDAASPGDIVKATTGTYVENVTIAKALTLTAASDPEIAPGSGVGIDIAASDVTVQGMTIHDCAQGILVWLDKSEYDASRGYTDLNLLDNTIYDLSNGAWGFGIYVGTETERYDPGDPLGIYDPDLADSLLNFTGLEISGNEIYNTSGASITLQSMRTYDSNPLEIHDNHIHDNAMSGMWIDGCWDLHIEHNRLLGNSYGIFLSNYGDGSYEGTPNTAFDPKNIDVAQNIFDGNNYGVALYDGYPGLLNFNYNSISNNASMGFYNYLAEDVDATQNWWGHASGPNHSSNPGGTGNSVGNYVLFVPWFTGNIVCNPDPEYLTNADPAKIVEVKYLGGGGGLMYGYSLKFSWDGSKVSTAVGKVNQGPLLSDMGLTQFFAVPSGANEITVDYALLGAQPGVTGPGVMFTIEFTGVACGESDIDLEVIKIRDKDNNPLGGFFEDDGLLVVDLEKPVFVINGPWPDGECYNTAPVLDLGASDACDDLDDAFYRVDGGAWTSDVGLFTDYAGAAWSNAAWTLPGFAGMSETSHQVEFYCTDDIGNISATVSWTFIKDVTDPPPVTDFAASPGHKKVHLSWTNPGSDFDHVVVVRKPWDGVVPYDYPEYPQPADGYPVGPGDGVAVYSGTGTSHDDTFASDDRSIYFYRAFTYDCASNYEGGTAPVGDVPAGFAQGDRATNYWLGDVTKAGGGGYDGSVDGHDMIALSAGYWLYSPGSPPIAPHNQSDVGPTDDNSRLGLPLPDDYIDFEDLMIFAMNYGVVTPLGCPPVFEDIGDGQLRLALESSSEAVAGEEYAVSLVLSGNRSEVKGVSAVLRYDAGSLEFKDATRSVALASAGNWIFFTSREMKPGEVWLDVAMLGTSEAIHGSGELAELRFVVKGDAAVEITFADLDLRGVDNKPVDVVTEDLTAGTKVPSITRLLGAVPNPFAPSTAVHYELDRSQRVRLEVYDARGRLVCTLVDGVVPAGRYSAAWDGLDSAGHAVHSGVYFVKMRAGSYESTSKLIRLH
ncbi:MAG: right-handed parallel beta-helix repeat-containing protein [Candidatus Eisenbacteria bacterium]